MKKKVLSILLCICMVLTLLPTAALATAYVQNFDDGDYYPWHTAESGSGNLDLRCSDGHLGVTVNNSGSSLEDCRLVHETLSFDKTHTYRLSYKIYSDQAGKYKTCIQNQDKTTVGTATDGEIWHGNGTVSIISDQRGTIKNGQSVQYFENSTQDMQAGETLTVTVEFQPRESLADGAALWEFQFGGGTGTGFPADTHLLFDDISIEDLTSPENPVYSLKAYGVYVGGVRVTELNENDVLGDGTVSYTPASGDTPQTLTLNGANIAGKQLLNLVQDSPSCGIYSKEALTINTVADSTVFGGEGGACDSCGIDCDGALTLTGTGALTVVGEHSANASNGIKSEGAMKISGNVNVTGDYWSIYCASSITITGNANVTAEDGTNGSIYAASLTVNTTGTVNAPNVTLKNAADGSIGSALNGIVCDYQDVPGTNLVYTVYGNVTTDGFNVPDFSGSDGLIVSAGGTLTIPENCALNIQDVASVDGVPQITNSGTIINNGDIELPVTYFGSSEANIDAVSAGIKALRLSGSGMVTVYGEITALFNNSGEKKTVAPGMDLSKTTVSTSDTGYTYTVDAENPDTAILTLDDNTVFMSAITLPAGKNITIKSAGTTIVGNKLTVADGEKTDLTFSGGTVKVLGNIEAAAGAPAVTIENGADVICNVFTVGGGSAGTLEVTGAGSTLTAAGGLRAGTVKIEGGATVDASNPDGIAVRAVNGGVYVTGGSTLTTHCDYGVYVENGGFTVDSASTFTANASVAAVCVVDSTGAKTQNGCLSLANLPSGSSISSVKDNNTAYWSVISSGSTLSVTDTNNDPVTLTGAVKTLTLKYTAPTGGGTTGGGSATPTGTTVTNADGSKTTTTETTKSDGTKVTTAVTTNTDKSTKSVTTTEKKQSDGSTVKTETAVTTDSTGKTTGAQATIVTGSKTGEVTVPADVITALTKVEGSTLTVATPDAEIKLDHAALEALVSKGGTAPALTITPVPFKDLPVKAQANLTEATTYSFSVNGGSVDFGSGTVTVTLSYTRKAANTVVTVYFVDNDGNMTPMPGASYKNGKVSYDTNHFSLYAIEEETMPFTDVDVNGYCADSVLWAVKSKVTSGISTTAFAPNADCTRAQAVTFLWRAMGSPEPTNTKNPFTDVKSDAYYYKAVLWAVEKGITGGTTATTFSPDATVTRAQTVTFLYRAAGSPTATASNPFTDVPTGAYYADAVNWATGKGVTAGVSTTMFAPNASCTRGQIVTFLFRDLNK